MPRWMSPDKNPRHQSLGEVPWLAIPHTCCHILLLRELSIVPMTPLGEGSWGPLSPGLRLMSLFPLLICILSLQWTIPLSIITFLSSVAPSSKSANLRVVSEPLTHSTTYTEHLLRACHNPQHFRFTRKQKKATTPALLELMTLAMSLGTLREVKAVMFIS